MRKWIRKGGGLKKERDIVGKIIEGKLIELKEKVKKEDVVEEKDLDGVGSGLEGCNKIKRKIELRKGDEECEMEKIEEMWERREGRILKREGGKGWRIRNEGWGKKSGSMEGGVESIMIWRVGRNKNVDWLKNGRDGEEMEVVIIVKMGLIEGGRRKVKLKLDENEKKRIIIGLGEELGVFIMLRIDEDLNWELKEKIEKRKGEGRWKKRREGVLRRVVMRLGKDIGLVNSEEIERKRIEKRERIGRKESIGLMLGGVEGMVMVEVM